MTPANTKFVKKIICLGAGLGAMMAVSTHSFAEEDLVVALAPANPVPAHNDWRQLDMNSRTTAPSASYQIRGAGGLLKDAFVGLRSLFISSDSDGFASTASPQRQLVIGYGDMPYIDNTGNPSPKIMGKTASTATSMITEIVTTAWLDQEVRSLRERDGNGDFDSNDPWRMGIRLNMPF